MGSSLLLLTRGGMTFDRFVLSFMENPIKRPFQVDDQIHQRSFNLNFLVVIFMLSDFGLKVIFLLTL